MQRKHNAATIRRTRAAAVAICATLTIAAASAASPDAAVGGTRQTGSPAAARNGAATTSRATLHRAGTSTPHAAATTPTGSHIRHQLPVLRPSNNRNVPPASSTSSVPSVRSARSNPTASGRLIHNFDGIDAIRNSTATGYDVDPPDEGLGASRDWVVNFVNVSGAIYRHDGEMVGSPFALATLFKEPDSAYLSDPRVFYDASTSRWFGTLVEYAFNDDFTAITESHVDLAVSSTGDPNGHWKIYRIPTSNPSHSGCPCLADYPILGIDKANVYITTSEFTSDLNSYNGAQLYALSKSQLVAGAPTVNMVAFENLSAGGTLAGHVQPANSYGRTPGEFLLSTVDPNGGFDHTLAVWAVTHEGSVTSGHGMPVLSVRVIGSEGYVLPPNARTPKGFCSACGSSGDQTTGLVATDFSEMQEAQYINGRLVGALNTGITVPGDSQQRAGIAWFVIRPHVSNGAVSTQTHIGRQGYLAMNGQYLMYPHVNMTPDGAMALVFGVGGPGTYLSSAYSVARPGKRFHRIRLAAPGTGPDNSFTGTPAYGGVARWGDYSNGQIIPGTRRVWLATQYIPNPGDGYANWGNRILELKLP